MSDNTPEHERTSLEKGKDGPPKPVGFFHKSLRKEWLQVWGRWILMTIFLSTFILAILSLYWAVLFRVEARMSSLVVYVVNFETASDALVGPTVTQITEGIVRDNTMPHLGYVTVLPEQYDFDNVAVREDIYQEYAWAAIVINSNATQLLRQAVGSGNSSYDPTGAIQLVYNEARDQDTYSQYIYPMIQQLQTQIMTKFGQSWIEEVMANTAVTKANMESVPQAINPAIGFSTFNLRPFTPPTATPAVSIGLIYLIILSFFSFSFYLPIHMRLLKGPGHAPIKFWQFILWRWFATISAYFILSLAYSLVSLAFQIPFNGEPPSHLITADNPSKFYRATFLVYWMINFFGMIALGLACENMAMLLGMPWTALWLIFWVITNVSTSFYAIDLEAPFFRWGYAWPLHNVVEASRTVLFDLRNQLGLNFGILIAWGAVSTVLFPFACMFMRWKENRAQKKDD